MDVKSCMSKYHCKIEKPLQIPQKRLCEWFLGNAQLAV